MSTAQELFERGCAAHQSGALDEAERYYRQLLETVPDHASGLTNLGALVARSGRTDEAEQLYLRAIEANPNQLDAHFNLGNLYRRLRRPQDAIPHYEETLRISPDSPAALVNLGLAVSDQNDWPRAIECFARAVTVNASIPDGLVLLGDALARCGRRDEALAAFREAVSRFPDSPRPLCHLGIHLTAANQCEEAIDTLEKALTLRPDYAEARNALGAALEGVGRTDDAQREYRTAMALNPNDAHTLLNLGTSLAEQGQIPEAITVLRKSLSLVPDPLAGHTLLANLLHSDSVTAEQLRDEHIAWAQQHAEPLMPPEPVRKRQRNAVERVRVGYVMGEFRSRSAVAFLETLLTHHDRSRFHITVYANVVRNDDTQNRLRRLADSWKSIAQMPDEHAAKLIRDDEIDILVDLNGHNPGNRLLLFARKPAATQISLFGYPATTGLKAMDFRITDATTDVPGQAEPLYVEKLLRLPETGWLYAPPANAPTPNAMPAAKRRVFTFGCLNHPAKLSDACVETWCAILKAVPKSRFVLLAGQSVAASTELAKRFLSRGVSSDRLELVYRLSANDYYEAYQPLDLTLDPFPHGGAVTTCDSLWMGIPVLTVAGRDARGRQAVSLLNALGMPEFIADTPEQLVTLATTWADQRDALADLRDILRDMVRQSPLTAAIPFVKHLESAYLSV